MLGKGLAFIGVLVFTFALVYISDNYYFLWFLLLLGLVDEF